MKRLITLLLFIVTYTYVHSQSTALHGRILSDDGTALPGVNISIKGTTIGTITDAGGNYAINVPERDATLLVSFIGYESQEVGVTVGQTEINLTLKAGGHQLNEVVVVAYGTQEKKNLIGSVSKIDPSATNVIPVGSFDAQLQGKVAGVQISSNTGVPGEGTTVRVRGTTSINSSVSPLYVVDGVFINGTSLQTMDTGRGGSSGQGGTSPIADINPSDIESIEVLKDAEATALYGSRGANGVIIVTTKRGHFEQKPTISFNASQGWAKAAKLWDLTTGPEHATLVNEYYTNIGKQAPFVPATETANGQPGRGTPDSQKTYDRLDQVFRTAHLQNYDLSVAGGTASTKYYIGGGYNSQQSILRPIDFNRASFKVNLDQKINKRVTLSVSNTFTRTYRNQGHAGDGPSGGLLQAALHTPTYLSPYNDQGQLVGRAGFDNVQLLLNYYDEHTTSLRYIGNVNLEAELLPGLKFKTSFGADYNNYNEFQYWNTYLILGSSTTTPGYANSNLTQNTVLLNEQTLNYRKHIGEKHTFGVLIGNTLQSSTATSTGATGRGFANNSIKLISQASTVTGTQGWTKSTLASVFARADYNYDNKYLVDVNFRGDGSSRFGSKNRWGFFPSVGAAWRIKQEEFLKTKDWLSDLKFRATYGLTGNQSISDFPWQGTWSAGSSYQSSAGISPQQIANQNLKWEETRQFNIGLNAGFLNDRISFEFNWYDKYTYNGLYQKPLPATTGFSSFYSNDIQISNKGFEFSISTQNIVHKNFRWTTDINIAQNKNKIEKLATPMYWTSRNLLIAKQGEPLYSFYLYKQLYVDPQTGNAVYDNKGTPGPYNSNNRQVMGSLWPKFFGGITNTFSYKTWDVNLFFSYQYGNNVYNYNRFFGEAGGARDAARVIFKSDLGRWQKPGDITNIPKADGSNVNNYVDGGSRWLEDASFLRLRSLTVGYTLPIPKSHGFDRLRVFVVGTNLLLFTKYTGLDPESSAYSDQNQQGVDLGTPPQPRGFQVGLDLKL